MLKNIVSLIITICILLIVISWIMERVETGNFSLFNRHHRVGKQIDHVQNRTTASPPTKNMATESAIGKGLRQSSREQDPEAIFQLDRAPKHSSDSVAETESDQSATSEKTKPISEQTVAFKPFKQKSESATNQDMITELPEETVYDLNQRQIDFDRQDTDKSDGTSSRNVLADAYTLLDNVNKMLK